MLLKHVALPTGKVKCKAALQKELGFTVDARVPLVGWIGRLDFQKGPDVVLQSIPEMARRGCQVCVCQKPHNLMYNCPPVLF